MPSRHISNNLDDWKGAGYWPRHRRMIGQVEGSVMEWGIKAFDRIEEMKLRAAVSSICQPGGTLFLHGPRGTGKTQFATYLGMAVAVIRGAEDERVAQLYASLPQFMARVKAGFENGKAEVFEDAVVDTGLLVLDEIQEGVRTDFERDLLTRIMDHRYGHMSRTILIANLDSEAIQGAVGTSVYSRLCETGAFLACDWEPYR